MSPIDILFIVVVSLFFLLNLVSAHRAQKEREFYLSQIQTLVDKVKSQSFGDYKRAEQPLPRVQADGSPVPPEDLRQLQEFSLGI